MVHIKLARSLYLLQYDQTKNDSAVGETTEVYLASFPHLAMMIGKLKMHRNLQTHQGKLICLFGSKGGVGKTMTSLHFARLLAANSNRVAILQQGPLEDVSTVIGQAKYKSEKSTGTSHPLKVGSAAWSFDVLSTFDTGLDVDSLKHSYDYVITELSLYNDQEGQSLIRQSDIVVLLTTSEPLAMQSMKKILDQDFSQQQSLFVFVNQVKNNSEMSLLRDKISKIIGLDHSFKTIFIPEDVALQDDIMRQDLFGSDYLTRISGQAWRQALEKILHEITLNQSGETIV